MRSARVRTPGRSLRSRLISPALLWLFALVFTAHGTLWAGMSGGASSGSSLEICTALGTQLVSVDGSTGSMPDGAMSTHCLQCVAGAHLALSQARAPSALALELPALRVPLPAERLPDGILPYQFFSSRAPPLA